MVLTGAHSFRSVYLGSHAKIPATHKIFANVDRGSMTSRLASVHAQSEGPAAAPAVYLLVLQLHGVDHRLLHLLRVSPRPKKLRRIGCVARVVGTGCTGRRSPWRRPPAKPASLQAATYAEAQSAMPATAAASSTRRPQRSAPLSAGPTARPNPTRPSCTQPPSPQSTSEASDKAQCGGNRALLRLCRLEIHDPVPVAREAATAKWCSCASHGTVHDCSAHLFKPWLAQRSRAGAILLRPQGWPPISVARVPGPLPPRILQHPPPPPSDNPAPLPTRSQPPDKGSPCYLACYAAQNKHRSAIISQKGPPRPNDATGALHLRAFKTIPLGHAIARV